METLRGRGLQQVRRLGLRKVGDRALRVARAGLNPLWAWLSSPTPMGWPGAGGSQEPKSPSEGCRREGAYCPHPWEHSTGSFPLTLPFVLVFGRIPSP